MKKIWNGLFIAGLLAGIVGCGDCDCPKLKECQEKLASCEGTSDDTEEAALTEVAQEELDSATVVANLVASIGNGFLSGPLGNLSDGDTSGYNICVEYTRKGVVASILSTDGKTAVKKGSISLGSNLGIEIYLKGPNPDLYFGVVNSKFKKLQHPLTLGGTSPKQFDCKISAGCRAIDPTNEPPAIVGVNDARTAGYVSTNGIIGNLTGGNRIRIHANMLPAGGFDVVFSSDSLKIDHSHAYKFSDLGVPKWGCDFGTTHP